jgi:hypothetical protein
VNMTPYGLIKSTVADGGAIHPLDVLPPPVLSAAKIPLEAGKSVLARLGLGAIN